MILISQTYQQHLQDFKKYSVTFDSYASYGRAVYDSVYALALALNTTEELLQPYNMTLSDFQYNNTFIFNKLFQSLKDIQFLGASVSSLSVYSMLMHYLS